MDQCPALATLTTRYDSFDTNEGFFAIHWSRWQQDNGVTKAGQKVVLNEV
tara:strand:+ start:1190 stop:1339 length:150 start_codon:yes stop_codon:yes gene_type:complete